MSGQGSVRSAMPDELPLDEVPLPAVRLEEVPLEEGTLVIADLHLDVTSPELVAPFARWLDDLARVPRLLILGDLFDVWVGPAQAHLDGAAVVLDAMRRLTERGTAIELVPGNRDFLLGRSFEERTGARLHADGFAGAVIGAVRAGADSDLAGADVAEGHAADGEAADGGAAEGRTTRRILFVHGDTLCTLDRGYLRLRRVLRSRAVRWLSRRMPLPIGMRVARRLRRASVKALAAKRPEEKSIQRDAVVATARAAACGMLVCGHAHEFRDERLAQDVRFVVVGAFGGARDVLRLDARGGLVPCSSAGLRDAGV